MKNRDLRRVLHGTTFLLALLFFGADSIAATVIDGHKNCYRGDAGQPFCTSIATGQEYVVTEEFFISFMAQLRARETPARRAKPQPTAAGSVSPEAIFETASDSIVTIVSVNSTGAFIGLGSGVVIRAGLVTTNCHVLRHAAAAAVLYKGVTFEAEVTDSMIDRDLCLLSVAGLNANSIKMGSTSAVKVGQKVFALGAPHGLELTFSEGMVSSLRKTSDLPIIQTTAPISPGSSGGALLSQDGALIGITTMQMGQGQNLNFAIPVGWISDFRTLK